MYSIYFFFQAEAGIRDADVTGVLTCALPISGFERTRSSRNGHDSNIVKSGVKLVSNNYRMAESQCFQGVQDLYTGSTPV